MNNFTELKTAGLCFNVLVPVFTLQVNLNKTGLYDKSNNVIVQTDGQRNEGLTLSIKYLRHYQNFAVLWCILVL